jgi:hypothetical protein
MEYVQEYVNRMSVEEPTSGGPFLQFMRAHASDDVRIAPLPGGAAGMLAGYFPWLRARYPHEADDEITSYCRLLSAHDEADLLRKLTEEGAWPKPVANWQIFHSETQVRYAIWRIPHALNTGEECSRSCPVVPGSYPLGQHEEERLMEQPLDEGTSGAQVNQPTVAKKPYVTPILIEYGDIAKLTAAGFGSAADGPVGFMMGRPWARG